MKLYSSTKTITPDALISLISEEYERQQTQGMHQSGGNGKSKDQDHDEALNVSSEKSSGKKKFERKPKGVCWNCGEKGHFKDKCPKPATDKKNDSPKPKSGIANAMIDSDLEEDGAFLMEPIFNDEDVSEHTPVLDHESVEGGYSSNGGELDWFSKVDEEVGTGWDSEELSGLMKVSTAHLSMLTWNWMPPSQILRLLPMSAQEILIYLMPKFTILAVPNT